MEAYVLLGLVSIGYMFARGKQDGASAPVAPRSTQMPDELAAYRRYQPQISIDDVRSAEMMKAQSLERAARYPIQSGAVDPRSRTLDGGTEGVHSRLAGVNFSPADFRHTNMQPSFGSSVKQSVPGENDTGSLLERFAGAPGVGNSEPKRETIPMFSPEERVENPNIYGAPAYTDLMEKRIEELNSVNRVHNNELPFDQVRVGPGLGRGYDNTPGGGFAHNEDRDLIMGRYKDVNEIRPGDKPKVQMEGRVVPGAAPTGRRGLVGVTSKNKPNTAFDIDGFGLLPASKRQHMENRPDVGHVSLREAPTTYRVEPAGASRGAPIPIYPEQAAKIGAPKLPHETPQLTGVSRTGYGDGASMQSRKILAGNERTATDAKFINPVTHAGPPGGPIPAFTVRSEYEDGLRISGKEHTSDATDSHAFGMMSATGKRGPVYDPGSGTRTTMKETQVSETRLGAYKREQGQVADEGTGTRRTVREGFCDTYDTTSIRNPRPNMFQEGEGAPNADPRLDDFETTKKDLVACGGFRYGIAAGGNDGGYMGDAMGHDEPRYTSRQFTEQSEYYGVGGKAEPHGYGVTHEALKKNSHVNGGKPDFEYYGIPRSSHDKGIDYEAVYAATFNKAKESLLESRLPGGHAPGGKMSPALATSGEVFGRVNDPTVQDYMSGPNMPARRGEEGSVMFKSNVGLTHDDRIDDSLLSYLKTNPLVVNPAVEQHRSILKK